MDLSHDTVVRLNELSTPGVVAVTAMAVGPPVATVSSAATPQAQTLPLTQFVDEQE